MRKYLLGILFLVLVSVAGAVPMIPNLVGGAVSVNGAPAVDGLLVEAKIGSVLYGDITTEAGTYELAISGLTQDDIGKTVDLYVDGMSAGTIDVIDTSVPKAPRVKDLAITIELCGNGVIDGTEQCDGVNLAGQTCVSRGYASGTLKCSATCTFDTSLCVAAAGGGASGGGGGGGGNRGSSEATDMNPIVENKTTVTSIEDKTTTDTSKETTTPAGAGVTGAFTGLVTPTNIAIVGSLVVLLGGGAAYLFLFRKPL